MRKILNFMILVILLTAGTLGLSACSAKKPSKPIIAVSLPTLDNPLMVSFSDAFTKTFGTDYDVKVASADNSPTTQAAQIENYITMKAKFLFCMPVESTSLASTLVEARAKGVLVFVAGTNPGKGTYDAVDVMDQYLAGQYEGLMAKQWIEQNYPNAVDNSIDAAFLQSTLNQDAIDRTNGIASVLNPYLEDSQGNYIDLNGNVVTEANRVANPVYIPQLHKVTSVEASMFQPGQTATENILTQYPNVKIVLAYDSDAASGASTAITDYLNGADSSKYATFGVGMFGPEQDTLIASSQGNGVLRGCIAFGSNDLVGDTVAFVQKMLNGQSYDSIIWDPLSTATVVNGQVTLVTRTSSGVINVN